ncbi:recombination and repair protein RecT [Mycobacteroides abscessus subsp. abscessus]|uniref:recombinase RecT n=1 Tax=Mycobacteroides abscessus TaxID=36809 RepID=UPI0009D3203C|nr:recombinase RecT [Mycobacteroides abscessus]SKU47365.1 recombination and repair protein RecT [Mycobacteroides abscessus subsp. abscessus]SKY44987.1 recombination and repair protein RecT [Mycobacteroides abscessus subsp. abscessus]
MTSTDVAKTEQKPPTLAQLIERQKPEIARALPRHMNPDRMARIAVTVLRQTPRLAQCTPESFLGALMTCSQLGLEPGPLGHAYLVPYKREVTFIPGYRGLVDLAYRSGQVATVKAQVVYEADEFDFEEGLDAYLKHKRSRAADPGQVIWVYALVKLKDGASNFVVMTVAEVEKIRKRSMAANNGPWVTDWEAMAKKTALKQLSKWMPLSPEFNQAVNHDGSVRTDAISDLVDVKPEFVDGEVVDDGEPAAVAPAPSDSAGEVRMASGDQLARLKKIRTEQGFGGDDSGWFDYVLSATQAQVSRDQDLTEEQAQSLIDMFNEDAAK